MSLLLNSFKKTISAVVFSVKNSFEKIDKKFSFPYEKRFKNLLASFNFLEKTLFYLFLLLLIAGAFISLIKINNLLLVEVPKRGGEIKEGVVGTPRFINPLLSISDADRDLTQLIYSGLLRATPDGDLVPDLAKSYEISEDGLEYVFEIKDEATFQDGTPVTADDVVFTINLIKDNSLRSSKRANWEGVLVEKIDEKTVKFRLAEAYSPFLENTTMGILPKHLWEKFASEEIPFVELNTNPVGSGPYKISSIKRDSSGVPTDYSLEPFSDYVLGEPYISKIKFKFYKNEEGLIEGYRKGEVDNINSITAEKIESLAKNDSEILSPSLPRVFGVFFNQNEADIFTNREVRLALDLATDKEKIVQEVLSGYGKVIDTAIPPSSTKKFRTRILSAEERAPFKERVERAREILDENGWDINEDGVWENEGSPISFSIATSNSEELKKVAQIIKEDWEDLGAEVEIKVYDMGTLNQEIIRPREYQTLLFGEIVGRDLDLFAFWHSSQRNDPGLNIALYTNITVDNIVEEIRKTFDEKSLARKLKEFNQEIESDIPAIFLYSPDFIYVADKDIKGMDIGTITTTAERFLNVYQWYTETDKVWTFLN